MDNKKKVENGVKFMITILSTFRKNKICAETRIQICYIKIVLYQ